MTDNPNQKSLKATGLQDSYEELPYEVEVEISVALLQTFFSGELPVFKEGMEAGEVYKETVTFRYPRRPADHKIAVDGIHYESDLLKKIIGMKGRVVREGWKEGQGIYEYYLTQRPPDIGTYPTDDILGYPEETQSFAYDKRTVYRLKYPYRLSEEVVRKFELLPEIPDSVRERSYYPLKLGKFDGKLVVESISDDRTEVEVREVWESDSDHEPESQTMNTRGLLQNYPGIFYPLVYGVPAPEKK